MRRATAGLLLVVAPLALLLLVTAPRRHAPARTPRPVPAATARPEPVAAVGREDERLLVTGLERTASMVLRETTACPDRRISCQRVALGRAATAGQTLSRFAGRLQGAARRERCRARIGLVASVAGGLGMLARDIETDQRPGTTGWAAGRRAVRRVARRMRTIARLGRARPACGPGVETALRHPRSRVEGR